MDILQEIADEYAKARAVHKPMHSPHEGYAVIKEEVDELWDEIKKKYHDIPKMRKEAIQVAAMAVAFVTEICDSESTTN